MIVFLSRSPFFLSSTLLAQSPVTGAALVRGSLDRQYARHILTVSAWDPTQPLTLLLEYSPQNQWQLDDRSGFFLFDQKGFDRYRAGAIPGSVSIAAGDRLPGEGRRLQATIGAPVSGGFIVMVYNDSAVPMGYTLRAINGGFSDSGGQVYDGGAPAPASGGSAPVYPFVVVPGPTPAPNPAPGPPAPLRASVLRGWLDARYAQDFFTLEVVDTGLPLTIEMTYDPADQIRLLDSFNFWLFDEEQFRTQEISGARPEFEPNRAAGQLIYRDDVPHWTATIERPLGRYWLVVNQHEHSLAVGYRLTVENGVLVDEGQQAQEVLSQPRTLPGVGNTLWIVRRGDTLGSIAQAVYGNRRYYTAICARNGMFNCNRLYRGQRLILPPVGSLPQLSPTTGLQTVLPTRPPTSSVLLADNLLDVAAGQSRLQTVRDLLRQTSLAETLTTDGPYTLFAFTNGAFDSLPVETQDALLLESDTAFGLLAGHIASGRLNPSRLTRARQIAALNGALLRLEPDPDGSFTVNGVPVIGEPLEATNGVIFVVDTALSPQN